jgi:dihydroorotase/allantoinase
VLDRDTLQSKSKSTPFDGERFVGKPTMTVVRGTVTYDKEAIQVEVGYGELVSSGETTANAHPRGGPGN